MLVNFLIFFFIGCVLLLLLLIIVYKTGLVHKTRDSAGHLKKKQNATSIMIMGIVFFFIISFFILFQIYTFDKNTNFFIMLSWTFLLLQSLALFDALIIDLLIIGTIRPEFLKIPKETTLETMIIHIKKTYTLGWIFMIPIPLISTTIAYYI